MVLSISVTYNTDLEIHNVVHAVLDVTSLIYDVIQQNKQTALLLMDLRKAFDTCSHKILLEKLYHYGIRGPAHDLIKATLPHASNLFL